MELYISFWVGVDVLGAEAPAGCVPLPHSEMSSASERNVSRAVVYSSTGSMACLLSVIDWSSRSVATMFNGKPRKVLQQKKIRRHSLGV